VTEGNYSVEVTGACGSVLSTSAKLTVNALPNVVASASSSAVCSGDMFTLTATRADTYNWGTSIVNGVPFTPSATATYTVIGTDVNNCSSTAQVSVVVNALPNVVINASSSAVYGANTIPFSTKDSVDHPVSIYAATKKANELMAHTYSHLYGIPTTGLRFFTVYGPWGRPDMAYFSFTKKILDYPGHSTTEIKWLFLKVREQY
jgi:hypothetical protein